MNSTVARYLCGYKNTLRYNLTIQKSDFVINMQYPHNEVPPDGMYIVLIEVYVV